jgi:urea carboxylase system permease
MSAGDATLVIETAPSRDAEDLAMFGYRQRLNRTLGGFSALAAGLSYLSILTGVPQLFYLGFASAGPAFFWTWPVVFIGQFLVALCFAELASRYPLSGGIYQWAKHLGPRWIGWMAGWVYLACAAVTLASVALALQATITRIAPWTQFIGQAARPVDAAKNAVILGCSLIGFSTLVNAFGVRLLARLNNIGVIAEMAGALILVMLLGLSARRDISVVFSTLGRGHGGALGYLGAYFAAALAPSFVMYGFDTAGSLAEETSDPRRNAPRAILTALASVGVVGALLIACALMAVPNLQDPQIARSSGGMPWIIKQVLGEHFGVLLLADIALAITICTLTVHAAAVRLVFAMARDNAMPAARQLAHVAEASRTPILPAIVLGLAGCMFLVINIGFPKLMETLVAVSIAWANLAYLFVTVPMLLERLRRTRISGNGLMNAGLFSMGRWGLPVNAFAVLWGIFVVFNVSWPRSEIYGTEWYRRFGAPLATVAMLASGGLYYTTVRSRRPGILWEHRALVGN